MQGNKLYIGNFSYSATDEQIEKLFSSYGEVVQVNIIGNKGFGFVEMASLKDGQAAISGLNGREMDGRQLAVSQAKPQENRGGRDRY